MKSYWTGFACGFITGALACGAATSWTVFQIL